MYELGCAINHLRNKQGTGHGRPWLPSVTEPQVKGKEPDGEADLPVCIVTRSRGACVTPT